MTEYEINRIDSLASVIRELEKKVDNDNEVVKETLFEIKLAQNSLEKDMEVIKENLKARDKFMSAIRNAVIAILLGAVITWMIGGGLAIPFSNQ